MAPPKPYTPTGWFPDLTGADPDLGPLELQEDNDEVLFHWTWESTHDLASVANTSPIEVTTDDAHRYVTGDKVFIDGSGVVNAEGLHTITVITSNRFSLNGTTAGGSSSGQGRVFHPKLGTFGRIIDALGVIGGALGLEGGSTAADALSPTVPVVIDQGLTVNKITAVGGTQVVFHDPIQAANSTVYAQLDHFTPTADPDPDEDFGANHLTAPLVPKAWGLLRSDSMGGVDVAGGVNVASVVLTTNDDGWVVTLATEMEDTFYAITATHQLIFGSDDLGCWVPKTAVVNTSSFEVRLQRSTNADPATVDSVIFAVSFHVFGRQTVA